MVSDASEARARRAAREQHTMIDALSFFCRVATPIQLPRCMSRLTDCMSPLAVHRIHPSLKGKELRPFAAPPLTTTYSLAYSFCTCT